MEVAGLVIGAVSLAALFNSVIDDLEYFSAAQNHGRDFELASTKIVLLKARLAAWGEALRVASPNGEAAVLREAWSKEKETVAQALVGIQQLFEDTDRLQRRYGVQKIRDADAGDSMAITSPASALSEGFSQIQQRFKSHIEHRQTSTSAFKKARWAIRDKTAFNALIVDLDFFVSSLEALADRLNKRALAEQLLQMRVEEVCSPEGAELLMAAAQETTDAVEAHAEETGRAAFGEGHKFIANIATEHSRVVWGNVGDPGGRHHLYERNTASGNTRSLFGNMTPEAAADFWKQ